MNCDEMRVLMLEYIYGNLREEESEVLFKHIEECEQCREEYNNLKEVDLLLDKSKDNIEIPENFIDNVEKKLKESTLYRKPIKVKRFKSVFIAAAILILSVFTVLAAENKFIDIWSIFSNDNNIQNAVDKGFGTDLNISRTDKNIRITITDVVADDLGTVVSYKVEDLTGKNNYNIALKDNGCSVDNYWKKDFGPGGYTSIRENHVEGKVDLAPLDEDEKHIKFIVSKLKNVNDDNLTVEGNWTFEFDAKKYKSKVYKLDKKINIDGYNIKFKEIEVALTETILTYEFTDNIENEDFTGIRDVYLTYKDKEYAQKRMFWGVDVGDEIVNTKELVFDSMYFDDPKYIKINIKSYGLQLPDHKEFQLDINKPLPQKFEYMGSNIWFNNKATDEEGNLVLEFKCDLENRKYEGLNIKISSQESKILSDIPVYGSGIIIDNKGQKYNEILAVSIMGEIRDREPEFFETDMKGVIYSFNTETEDFVRSFDELKKPLIMTIDGYTKNVTTNKSTKIKLNNLK